MPRMVQRCDGQGKMVYTAFGHFLRYDFHTLPERSIGRAIIFAVKAWTFMDS